MPGHAIPLQVIGLKPHHTVVSVRKSPDGLIRRIHKLPQLDGEFLHRLLPAQQVLTDFKGREICHAFGLIAHHCSLKKSGLTIDSSLGSRSISTAWLKNWSGK